MGIFLDTLDTLSRLKGIETHMGSLPTPSPTFRYAFPFEGN